MTISSTNTKNSYSGDGSTVAFSYTFKILDDDDIQVILRTNATGAETVQTKTTHYTVSGVGNAGGGTITFVSAPAATETVVLLRNTPLTQATDYTPNDPFPAAAHEDALDKLTFLAQEIQEELDRSIKVSKTNTITSPEFTVGATDRANRIFAFDSNGDLSVTQEIGTYQGTDATTTTSAYSERDIIKSTTAAQLNNVYICVADSVAGDLLTDTDHFELLVDAVSAATSATNAANSATAASNSASAAATSESNAATSATSASTAQTAAETAQTAAEAAQAAAELAADNFDDIYLGAKASDPTLDNDGDALTAGDIYFNTSDNSTRIYDGSAWNTVAPDLVGDATPQLGGNLDTNGNDINFGDNDKAVFGAGSDLQIYHDGTHSYISDATGTGNLYLQSSSYLVLETGNGNENYLVAQENGPVTLYYDSAAKLATTSSGIDVTGNATFDDNGKAIFGAGNDFEIFHDGSNTYLSESGGTGNVYLRANNLVLLNNSNETYVDCVSDGAVTLYHNNAVKVATTATGVSVTGTALATTDTDTTNSGNVTLDFGANQNFVLTLTGNVTLDNPTTEQVGQSGFIVFIQDATGGRTVSLGTDYETAGGAGLTLSTAASTTDIVPYVVAASGRILLGAPQLAFA